MNRYAFPAVFDPEEEGGYSIFFPDIDGAFSQGDDMPDCIYMASDCLVGMLAALEDSGNPIPEPTPLDKVVHDPDQIVTLIFADTVDYRKKFNNKSTNVTLTLPKWLYTIAKQKDINLSQTLKEALKAKLGIEE